MSFEPKNFFVGLIDFFSILMPGALFTFLVGRENWQWLLGKEIPGGTEGWIVFLFASYLLGHFIFLIGSLILDDHIYDRIRDGTFAGQIRRLAKGKKLSTRLSKWLAKCMVKKVSDDAVRLALIIRENYLNSIDALSAINVFQWCKAVLTLEKPGALEVVQRFEADSKFFRSLIIVLCIIIPLAFFQIKPVLAITSLVLMIPAFWRYVDQRVKATNQAYWYIITLEADNKGGIREVHKKPDEITHAGGIVFRKVNEHFEYLIVQAKDTTDIWVLPKGHIKAGESMEETAVREVHEESGVWARTIKKSIKKLDTISYSINNVSAKVQFFIMEALSEEQPKENRKHKWLPFEEAHKDLSHQDHKKLIKTVNQLNLLC